MKNNLEIFNRTIQKARTISVCSHVSPDGDAVGSSTGLYLALKEMGKKVYLIKNDTFPTNLEFMNNPDYYYEGEALETDLFIVTDVASEDRIGKGVSFHALAKNSLCIDHHRTNSGFCRENIIVPTLSSTAELVASLLLDGGYKITDEIASFLFLGMITDTNRFQYESTSSDTLRMAADLIDRGARKKDIIIELYENLDPEYHLLQAEVMKSAKFFNNQSFILASLTREQLDRYNLDFDTTEGLVSILKSIRGIELACLVKENQENVQKVSFRSKELIDVSKIALEFGGGGHIRAAGCTIHGSNKEVYDKLYERLLDLE